MQQSLMSSYFAAAALQPANGVSSPDYTYLFQLGEFLDSFDGAVLPSDSEHYRILKGRAVAFIDYYFWHPLLDSEVQRSWSLQDIYEEVLSTDELRATSVFRTPLENVALGRIPPRIFFLGGALTLSVAR